MLATLAGSVLAALLLLSWQLRLYVKRKTYDMQEGKPTLPETPDWNSETSYVSDKLDAKLSTDKLLPPPTNLNASESTKKLAGHDPVQRVLKFVPRLTNSHSHPHSRQQSHFHTVASYEATHSTPFVSCETSSALTDQTKSIMWPEVEKLIIPAPLWQDVEIAASNISIAKTADGRDWVLGEGSYGMVGFTLSYCWRCMSPSKSGSVMLCQALSLPACSCLWKQASLETLPCIDDKPC